MPITPEELSKRLHDAYPRILQMRKAALALKNAGNQMREKRKITADKKVSKYNNLK